MQVPLLSWVAGTCIARQHAGTRGATASCRRPVCVPGGWHCPHTPGSKQMAAPASLAVCTADLTRSSGSSSNTNPLVNTAAVDCSACTRAHQHKQATRLARVWVRHGEQTGGRPVYGAGLCWHARDMGSP